jgi:hypothetical protein
MAENTLGVPNHGTPIFATLDALIRDHWDHGARREIRPISESIELHYHPLDERPGTTLKGHNGSEQSKGR